jgi:hypothetical protein
MTHDAAVEIAKKLKALAEKATEVGEKSSASKKLHEFCIKHDLDATEYEIETIKVSVPYTNEQEKALLSGVMCMVLEVDNVRGADTGNMLTFRCTQRQFEDITEAFQHYKKIYYDYADGVVASLITKNKIVNRKPAKIAFKMDDMTDDERLAYEAIMRNNRPTQTDQSGQTESPNTTTNRRPSEIDTCKEQKDDRIRRVFMVMEELPWVKKIRPRLFLR